MVTILGVEATAHTFGVGIVKDGKVIANQKHTYTTESGGIIPVEAAQHHAHYKAELYLAALDEAGIDVDKVADSVDAIAFSQGPGLPPCLREGRDFARDLALKLKKPLVPVNHCVAHLEIARVTGARDPVLLYASGANTQVIAYAEGKYRVFGETLDMGVGNFIDTFAREAGLGFPGGPRIEQLAKESGEAHYIELPYVVKGMDISLSGILTNMKQKLAKGAKLSDVSYSMQETVFAMLVEVAERALAHTGKKELVLGGGVACNKRLQEMCKIMCKERGAKFFVPENSLLVDNAAMIAYLGEIQYTAGVKVEGKEIESIDIKPRQRTDDVMVSWK